MTFAADFRRFFLRGLATLLPTVLTIVLLVKCFEFVQENISVHMTEGVVRLAVLVTEDYPYREGDKEVLEKYLTEKAPELDAAVQVLQEDLTEYITEKKPELDPTVSASYATITEDAEEFDRFRLWKLRYQWNHGPRALLGFGLAIILVYIVGRLLASYVGKKFLQLFETTVRQVPGFKQVYPYVKQVTDFLFGENKITFSRVVAVPYPREGIWSVGLVTGAGFRDVSGATKQSLLTVFVPSSPTPVTGYVIHVRKEEIIDLPVSIEEALRFAVSGGVIVPEHQTLPTQMLELSPGPALENGRPSQDQGD